MVVLLQELRRRQKAAREAKLAKVAKAHSRQVQLEATGVHMPRSPKEKAKASKVQRKKPPKVKAPRARRAAEVARACPSLVELSSVQLLPRQGRSLQAKAPRAARVAKRSQWQVLLPTAGPPRRPRARWAGRELPGRLGKVARGRVFRSPAPLKSETCGHLPRARTSSQLGRAPKGKEAKGSRCLALLLGDLHRTRLTSHPKEGKEVKLAKEWHQQVRLGGLPALEVLRGAHR